LLIINRMLCANLDIKKTNIQHIMLKYFKLKITKKDLDKDNLSSCLED